MGILNPNQLIFWRKWNKEKVGSLLPHIKSHQIAHRNPLIEIYRSQLRFIGLLIERYWDSPCFIEFAPLSTAGS